MLEIIRKYDKAAKESKAIVGIPFIQHTELCLMYLQIIPEIGLESAPADLISWILVNLIREKLSVGTKEVISTIHNIRYDCSNPQWLHPANKLKETNSQAGR